MSFLMQFLMILVLIVILLYVGHRLDEAAQEKLEKKHELMLELELAKPKYAVEFHLVNGTIRRTGVFEPMNTAPGSEYNMFYDSYKRAVTHISNCVEHGAIQDEQGITYPMCQIESIKPVLYDSIKKER